MQAIIFIGYQMFLVNGVDQIITHLLQPFAIISQMILI